MRGRFMLTDVTEDFAGRIARNTKRGERSVQSLVTRSAEARFLVTFASSL